MLIAQWVMNALQFLGLIALFWYTWETRKSGQRTAKQFELEWEPQHHFSIGGLDPTSGTGRLSGTSEYPVELTATVVNLGRPAFVVRGLTFAPIGTVSTRANIDPLPVATGQMQRFNIDPKPLLTCLHLREGANASDPLTWEGKVGISLWFEANGKNWKSPEQFFLVKIVHNKMISIQQITSTEFHYLERAPVAPTEP